MKIIQQYFEWEQKPERPLELIENAARTCYKSKNKNATETFIKGLIKSGHESTIEHVTASVRIITDRGVSHEIVRHRIASYSQESTRYCNYSGKMEFILPVWLDGGLVGEWNHSTLLNSNKSFSHQAFLWLHMMIQAEQHYNRLVWEGWRPEQARSVLPNSLKTELVMTCNLREWRHFFKLRTSSKAHPQIRNLASDMLEEFKTEIPIIFDDI